MPRSSIPTFAAAIESYRCASANVPDERRARRSASFSCLSGDGSHLRSGIILAPSLAYMERAYFDARLSGWSREPIVELVIPSLVDPSLAPPGKHVASLFCQHANPQLPDGRSWDAAKEEVAGSHARNGRALRARLSRERRRAHGAVAARSGARVRARRRRHLSSDSSLSTSSSRRVRCWVTATTGAAARAVHVRRGHASGGGVSGVPGTTRRARFFVMRGGLALRRRAEPR